MEMNEKLAVAEAIAKLAEAVRLLSSQCPSMNNALILGLAKQADYLANRLILDGSFEDIEIALHSA